VGRIRLLDDRLINRIAAGEVVERPASVVKELIENSLDAGAGAITIRLEGGGRQGILVEDDGRGMDRDDALLAVERHATSKIAVPEDLEAIATLGFRGEALASIAAVSHFTLRTAPEPGVGTEIEIDAGRLVAERRVGLPGGTSVRVTRLFHNVPARRKFLRADGTELSQAVRAVTRLALAHPECRWLLTHGERRLLEAQVAEDPAARLAQILGRELVERLVPFAAAAGGLRVHGWAGRPVDSLPRRDLQYLYVNRRAVQDRLLSHAVSQAYRNVQVPGRHPALVLFVELDPAAVDVNVHPQKAEVRFSRPAEVHDLVRRGIEQVLGDERVLPRLDQLRAGPPTAWQERTRESVLAFAASPPNLREPAAGYDAGSDECGRRDARATSAPVATPALDRGWPQVAPLGQLHDSYIVAVDAEGLLLVDQHAAHERVLFERYLAQAEADRVEVQRLLFPRTIELTPHERVALEGEVGELARLGFRVEPFGGFAVRLDGVPAVAASLDPEALLRELLGEAARCRAAGSDVAALRRRVVTTAACHAAIKVHYPLAREVMQALLADLFQTVNPTTCPHGRPVLFRLTLPEIERAFRRS